MNPERTDPPYRLLTAAVPKTNNGLALDLGAGLGHAAEWLADVGWRPVRAEIGQALVQHAAHRSPGAWVVADAKALPFADSVFSLVTALNLLHLLRPEGRQRALAEAARVTEVGGRLLFSNPPARCLVETPDGFQPSERQQDRFLPSDIPKDPARLGWRVLSTTRDPSGSGAWCMLLGKL
ncbi:MAG TPA: class I SAM-dependent methyltransferase [Chloroflexi bacterium]|nr:class I SAM-dependent methyltransferase [Chloroflexota bacterium]